MSPPAVSASQPEGPAAALLRVDAESVGRLMDLVGELSLSVQETVHSPDLQGLDLPEFEKSVHRLQGLVRDIHDAAAGLRLVPVDEVFRRMRRMVRELERQIGKRIELQCEGQDTAIDKVIADRLADPLLHVVRNAADHGLEPPAQRLAAGKPETGVITLAAAQVGGEIHITVSDDGRGLHRERILARARERGLVGLNDTPEDAALWKVIFQPGFSTAETVTNLSGRGVGMDVLNSTIRALRGRIHIDSVFGRGCRVTLIIPLTLAFLDSLVMRVDQRLYAIPLDAVSEILRPEPEHIQHISADVPGEVIDVRGQRVPVCRLPRFYGEAGALARLAPRSVVVVIETGKGRFGLGVDEMLGQQQVVMKALQGPLEHIRAAAGCALLGSGEVALVLDLEQLAEGAPSC